LSQPSIFGSGTGGAGSSDNQKIASTQANSTNRRKNTEVMKVYKDIFEFFI
jgi:hypothetical protein